MTNKNGSNAPMRATGEAKRFTGHRGRSRSRSYISVLFECCSVYNRVYINRSGTAYVGWCPKCCRRVEAKISPDGIDCRFFKAK